MKRRNVLIVAVLALPITLPAHGQESVIVDGPLSARASVTDLWAKFPGQGYVAYDKGGKVLDIFGPEADTVFANNKLAIQGYVLPEGGTIRAEGAFGYTNAANNLAVEGSKSSEPSAQDIAINQTVDSINNSNESVKDMCGSPVYPSKISMRVKGSAGIPGFGAEAEATVEWDLAAVCGRINSAQTTSP